MIIDTENLNTLSLPEIAALLLLYDKRVEKSRTVVEIRDVDIEKLLDGLDKKGLIISSVYATDQNTKPPFRHLCYSLIEAGRQALAENCISNRNILKTTNKESIKRRCDALAPQLQEIFPAGKKPGTSLMWRGSAPLVSKKLQSLIAEGYVFTDEEAIAATKAYVSGFNGNTKEMRVLIYFLSKNETVAGEVRMNRDFGSYVEDIRNNPEQRHISRDWDVTLK